VNVTDLTLPDAELRPTKAMRMRFDPVPVGYGFLDLFSCAANRHEMRLYMEARIEADKWAAELLMAFSRRLWRIYPEKVEKQ